ncbi:chloroplast division site-determinant protein [Raphidocelis subcapitata]|uniref:Chloroplast division site-determinant protein n=1 Tax=Raphidocelis subcapitata TaxID=307507 RepID=A0A2V0NYK2_9CHLO|nr:chloroplast division site-determinant protein [Raphidocelis subcapitata]|eukprot:GBF90007.1 chloroplast division site-determinant protein [Raphidocelis subcapitata]
MRATGSRAAAANGSAGPPLAAPRLPPRRRTTAVAASRVAAPGAPSERRERTIQSDDMVATSTALGTSINYKLKPNGGRVVGGGGAGAEGPVREFMDKLWLAWQIFFPERPPELTPKDGAKQRLRMILVADRCGMSPTGMAEMKKNILRALEDFVDIESEEQIDVSISLEPEVGTIYCVAVPVRRVKPEARLGLEGAEVEGMTVLEWDPLDKDSDPSSRFPMGC